MNTQAIARARQLGVKVCKADAHGRYFLEDSTTGAPIGLLQRARAYGPNGGGVQTWNGWNVASEQVVDNYPGSMAVALANVIHSSRDALEAAAAPAALLEQAHGLAFSAAGDLARAAQLAKAAGDDVLAARLTDACEATNYALGVQ